MTAQTDVRPAVAPPEQRRLPGPIQLRAMELTLRGISQRYGALQWFLEVMPPKPADAFSTARAIRTARHASHYVPAYGTFLGEHGIAANAIRSLDALPETDKKTYVDRFPLPERCLNGSLPLLGTTLDESSGSTGKPYNWARSDVERQHVRRMIQFFARYTFGDEPLVILNTFSMGAWATGMTMAVALEKRGLVKATGPDLDKVLDTMVELGPGYRYLVVGYPPFLKVLMDEGTRRGMDWSRYDMQALLGGEGNSEALRDYLLRHFTTVYSGYGVTDVEIGVAAETPVSIALRRLAHDRPDVSQALFGEANRSPMVFQYNPFFHHIGTNEAGELLFTVSRAGTLLPKVRYNPHDEGGVLRDDQLRARLAEFDISLESLVPDSPRRLIRMPYLYVFGRKDGTVSVMGANIYPEDIEAAIYADASVAGRILSWQLSVDEPRAGETRPRVAIQLVSSSASDTDATDPAFRDQLAGLLTDHLRRTNRDYREAFGEYPALMPVLVDVWPRGEGPFAGTERRIKFKYVVKG